MKRKVLITGGNSGIGYATASLFKDRGYQVTISGRDSDKLSQAAAELGVEWVVADMARLDDLKMLATRFNESGIDVLVNNAGASFLCPVEDMTPNGWDTIININLKGTFLCCRAVGRVMIQQKGGRIINIASTAGIKGSPGMAHYGAAKAAIINFTQSLGKEWAQHNINVNCIAPGLIETEGVKAQMHLTH